MFVKAAIYPRWISFWVVFLLSASVAQAEEYQLNLHQAELREFIDTVARLTGKTVLVDPDVSGQVDILSHRKLSKDELNALFQAQLAMRGYTLVQIRPDIFKVVGIEKARTEPSVVEEGQVQQGESVVTEMIEVKHVPVAKLVSVLRPLINSQIGLVEPFEQSNTLLITERQSNIDRLLRIIRQLDQEAKQRVEIIPVVNASAHDIQQILSKTLQNGANSTGGVGTVVVDNRTNSLMLTGSDVEREQLRDLIKQLDSPRANDSNARVIRLRFAKAEDLVEVLDSLSGTLLQKDETRAATSDSSTELSIKALAQNNALVLTGKAEHIKAMESLIRELDVRRAQVLVEAIIVELSESRSKELGLQWLFRGGFDHSTVPVGTINTSGQSSSAVTLGKAIAGGSNDPLLDSLSSVQGMGLGIGQFLDNGLSFSALLIALANDADSNILSTPSLLTLDNEEASILVGQEVPVITGSAAGSNNDNPFQTVSRKEIGIKLEVTPQINEGDVVQLAIRQEVSSLSGQTETDIITNKREINSTVLVDNGSVVILGGLIDDDIQESTAKVPLLGDLPIIGRSFRTDKTKRVKRNLMVFIRPTILRESDQLQKISRDNYQKIRTEQNKRVERGVLLLPDEEAPLLPEWEYPLGNMMDAG